MIKKENKTERVPGLPMVQLRTLVCILGAIQDSGAQVNFSCYHLGCANAILCSLENNENQHAMVYSWLTELALFKVTPL